MKADIQLKNAIAGRENWIHCVVQRLSRAVIEEEAWDRWGSESCL